jgi:hypothetical protein
MALADFVIIPIIDENDETVRVNKYSIIDVRVINLGKKPTQNENWYVQVNVLMGKYYLLRDGDAPYANKAAAITARDTFLATF